MSAKGRIWQRGRWVEIEVCCDAFGKATDDGTDNEGYGRLLMDRGNGSTWAIGCDLPPIAFCPWCGSKPALPSSP